MYWTVIPVLLVHFFANHPHAEYNQWRSMAVVVLTWVWAIRLTHNYFRREKWQWGAREDWRFTNMAEQHGQNWWWVSFFGVYLIQQVNLHSSNVFDMLKGGIKAMIFATISYLFEKLIKLAFHNRWFLFHLLPVMPLNVLINISTFFWIILQYYPGYRLVLLNITNLSTNLLANKHSIF